MPLAAGGPGQLPPFPPLNPALVVSLAGPFGSGRAWT